MPDLRKEGAAVSWRKIDRGEPKAITNGPVFAWIPDSNSTYRGTTTVSHTEGATVWKTNISGKPRWRCWIKGASYLAQTFSSEDEAKRYVEAMLPFVELQELK